MVRRKTLSPSGTRNGDGEYQNAHLSLHADELAVAGMDIGDDVFVMVGEDRIVVQPAEPEEIDTEI